MCLSSSVNRRIITLTDSAACFAYKILFRSSSIFDVTRSSLCCAPLFAKLSILLLLLFNNSDTFFTASFTLKLAV